MAGYIPLFASLTTGTLCGRWPDIGLWPVVLSLSDKFGNVDVTPMYLAGVTGLSSEEVVACMQRFCDPDPYSRTMEAMGARLRLIDEHRTWGWQIVNHAKYRERARKQAQQSASTETGNDAERKRTERAKRTYSETKRCPAMSSADQPSDSDSNENTSTNVDTNAHSLYDSDDHKSVKAVNVEELSSTNSQIEIEDRIFGHWRSVHRHERGKLDIKRREVIRARLKEGYSESDLCQSISGFKNSPFHQGQNKDGARYDAINIILRDSDQVDRGLSLYQDPPRTDLSEKSRRIVDLTESWVPPEDRNEQR